MTLAARLTALQAAGLPRLEAQQLLLLALGRDPHDRAWLTAHDDQTLDANASTRLDALLARLGKRDEALRDAKRALELSQSPFTLYQVAGIYALTSRQAAEDRVESLKLLRRALRLDERWVAEVDKDRDFDALREDVEFRAAVAAARALHGGV